MLELALALTVQAPLPPRLSLYRERVPRIFLQGLFSKGYDALSLARSADKGGCGSDRRPRSAPPAGRKEVNGAKKAKIVRRRFSGEPNSHTKSRPVQEPVGDRFS